MAPAVAGRVPAGAVLGAVVLAPLRDRVSPDLLLLGASLVYAAVTLVLAVRRSAVLAGCAHHATAPVAGPGACTGTAPSRSGSWRPSWSPRGPSTCSSTRRD
jgi:hypothetical protein